MTEASFCDNPAKEAAKTSVGGVIPREKRFEDSTSKPACDPRADYKPNYEFLLKKPAGVIIKKEENREELAARRVERRLKLFADLTVSCKAELSILTADTLQGAPGPGAYTVNYKVVEVSKTVGLPKANRFSKPEKDKKTPLEINYKWTDNKAPGVAIKKASGMNAKLLKIKKEEEVVEFQRAQRIIEEAKRQKEENLRLIVERKKIAAVEQEKRQPTEKERLFALFRIVSVH